MDGKINIEFTEEQFDQIMEYFNTHESETIQDAILNAIKVAMNADY